MCEENKIIAEIVDLRGIIYVDNPPINILASDDDYQETIEINRNRRKKSRNIILEHLETVCQGKNYKLKMWDKITAESDVSENLVVETKRHLSSELPAFSKIKFDAKSKKGSSCSIF